MLSVPDLAFSYLVALTVGRWFPCQLALLAVVLVVVATAMTTLVGLARDVLVYVLSRSGPIAAAQRAGVGASIVSSRS